MPEGRKKDLKEWRRSFQIKINGIRSRWKWEKKRKEEREREKNTANDIGNGEEATHENWMERFFLSLSFFNKKPVACAHPCECIEYRFAIGILYFRCFFPYKSQSINIERSKRMNVMFATTTTAAAMSTSQEKSLIARHADIYTPICGWNKAKKSKRNKRKKTQTRRWLNSQQSNSSIASTI